MAERSGRQRRPAVPRRSYRTTRRPGEEGRGESVPHPGVGDAGVHEDDALALTGDVAGETCRAGGHLDGRHPGSVPPGADPRTAAFASSSARSAAGSESHTIPPPAP